MHIHQSLLFKVTDWYIMMVFQNFELLPIQNSTSVALILLGLGYKVRSTFTTKFRTIELFILILEKSTIIHQLPCCYVGTTSKIGLYRVSQKDSHF